jgi:hypothetical protein
MRFSLKWLLAGMVYAAIAAAAFAKPHWAYADVLWTASVLAFAYAGLLAWSARGKAQLRALGFVIVCACVLAILIFAPDAMPTRRILESLGAFQTQINFGPISPQPASGVSIPPFNYGGASVIVASAPPPLPTTTQPTDESLVKLRAANAVAMMLAGLAGSVLGVVAYRRSQETSEGG